MSRGSTRSNDVLAWGELAFLDGLTSATEQPLTVVTAKQTFISSSFVFSPSFSFVVPLITSHTTDTNLSKLIKPSQWLLYTVRQSSRGCSYGAAELSTSSLRSRLSCRLHHTAETDNIQTFPLSSHLPSPSA